jgi:hypothetical protein
MPSIRAAKAAAAGSLKPPVAYTLLLKDADGTYAPVLSGGVFHAGDSVRLQIQPREAGYVYLFQHDSTTGAWILAASQSVEKDQRYELPSTGALHSDVPARLELSLVLSRVEHVDLDALGPQTQASSKITIEFR